jgi:hypothetical protein
MDGYMAHVMLQKRGEEVVSILAMDISPKTGNALVGYAATKPGGGTQVSEFGKTIVNLMTSEAERCGLPAPGWVVNEWNHPEELDPTTLQNADYSKLDPDVRKEVVLSTGLRRRFWYMSMVPVQYTQPGTNGCEEVPMVLFILDYKCRVHESLSTFST